MKSIARLICVLFVLLPIYPLLIIVWWIVSNDSVIEACKFINKLIAEILTGSDCD